MALSLAVLWHRSTHGVVLPVEDNSAFIKSLENAFGILPTRLNDGDISALERMKIENPSEEGYDDLISAIRGCGELTFWVEDLDDPSLDFKDPEEVERDR